MRHFILFIVITSLLFSCKGKRRSDPAPVSEEIVKTISLIDPQIKNAIYDFAGSVKRPEFNFNESCMVVQFIDDYGARDIYFSDTVAIVSYNICGPRFNMDDYKGIITVDTLNVAIFDRNNIGRSYYNSDSLKNIAFDSYKCIPSNIISEALFYVKNDSLKYWCP